MADSVRLFYNSVLAGGTEKTDKKANDSQTEQTSDTARLSPG